MILGSRNMWWKQPGYSRLWRAPHTCGNKAGSACSPSGTWIMQIGVDLVTLHALLLRPPPSPTPPPRKVERPSTHLAHSPALCTSRPAQTPASASVLLRETRRNFPVKPDPSSCACKGASWAWGHLLPTHPQVNSWAAGLLGLNRGVPSSGSRLWELEWTCPGNQHTARARRCPVLCGLAGEFSTFNCF